MIFSLAFTYHISLTNGNQQYIDFKMEGVQVGKYISIEMVVEKSKETY